MTLNSYASFGKRFAAFLIDLIIFYVTFLIATGKSYKEIISIPNGTAYIYIIVAGLITWIYFAGMESLPIQGTFGKKIVGIIVTDTNGNKISFAQATARYFAKSICIVFWIPAILIAAMTGEEGSTKFAYVFVFIALSIIGFLVLFIGYLMVLFTPEKQALHDIIARCLVVNGSGQYTEIPWKIIIALVITAILSRVVIAQFRPNPVPPPPPPGERSEIFGDLVEPNPNDFTYINGVSQLEFANGPIQHEAFLSMKGDSGIMIVQLPNGQGGTQRIRQNMKLWRSAKGLVLVGKNPFDINSEESSSTYAPDNFLIAIQPNGSPIFRNYSVDTSNNSPVVSPVNRDFLGYPTIGIKMVELNAAVRDKVNEEDNLPFRISQDTGVLIREVLKDSSAEKAGLQPGDIITSIDGTKVRNSSEVQQLVQSSILGDKLDFEALNFEIDRNGEKLSFTLRPGCCVKPESSQE